MIRNLMRIVVVMVSVWLAGTLANGAVISHWPFDGTAADEVGGRHGTEHGSPSYVTDPTRGTVLNLAQGDYIDFGDGPPDGAAAISITYWFKIDVGQTNGDLFVKYGPGSSNQGPLRIRQLDVQTFHICLGTEDLHTCDMITDRAFFRNWVFMALTYDEATGAWYNGYWVLNQHGSSEKQGLSGNLVDTAVPLQVGVNWAGQIDDLALWSTALTSDHLGRLAAGEPVPEPATLALMALGGLGLACRRRRT